MKQTVFIGCTFLLFVLIGCKPSVDPVKQTGVAVTLTAADNGDGTYTNPIIQADYSDPDAIRVGDDFYMTASSFNCAPGLPILHSKDLVNWQLITYACDKVFLPDHYAKPQHGNGIWAPSICYHNGWFYIFYGDPDFGIFMLKATKPEGPWSQPLLIKKAKGWIDPCPFWDADGNAYLVHAYAGSRAGIKSILAVNKMAPDGTALLDDGTLVFDGHAAHPTIEGPKLYKRNDYYYIFAPAGGVSQGWQIVLRSKNIYGPYEEKIVLKQGDTPVNGPHQGAWVTLANGDDWFIHFQDQEAYGRVVHLQPMSWSDDWPIMGKEHNGVGYPVISYPKPNIEVTEPIHPQAMDDEFNAESISPLWQWHANRGLDWSMNYPGEGVFRLFCQAYPDDYNNLWDVPALLLQKFPAIEFEMNSKIKLNLQHSGESCGLIVMGEDYCRLEFFNDNNQLFVRSCLCIDARSKVKEQLSEPITVLSTDIYLKLSVKKGARCDLMYSENGKDYQVLVKDFAAQPGRWIGAKYGFYALKTNRHNDSGWLDIDWVRYNKDN
ncbi:glycoside hydrolase 43 family protein [Carboxylicivirga sp. A043]|uniref:glycoside hydrolase family 43 protein n=1 Tax=Carboxylicivirga litoralis TaxID=2816963 RepID=UPI0021CB2F3C|nr:glycoside hydrolase 43 family protein [Carboxylicivirga sp. A043]MCU4158019.1 glycoside hydrolase 43 family protein [Carboxylicivirga sp. A043]